MRRLLAIILLGLVIFVALPIGTTVFWIADSLAPERGEFVVAGLDSEAEVYRDSIGVPYIFADSAADAASMLGFIHASERLWQMEAMRRHGHGRLAEVIGPTVVKSDTLMRTLGIGALANQQVSVLTPETWQILEAYARGVNAWIGRHRGGLPLEFVLLGLEPEPWTPADSLVWGRLMAMHLSGNWRDELLRARMAVRLTDEELNTFWYPDGESSGLAAITAPKDVIRGLDLPFSLKALAEWSPVGADQPVGASNAWAVTGDLTESGSSLLANDPHLGYSLPVLWFLSRIETPAGTLAGATVPGVPFMVLGHNEDIAWGMTTTQSDQQDIFIERLSDDGRFYENPNGQWREISTRVERIDVAGGETVTVVVRSTENGPNYDDFLPMWQQGQMIELATTRDDFRRTGVEPMRMLPVGEGRSEPGEAGSALDSIAMSVFGQLRRLVE